MKKSTVAVTVMLTAGRLFAGCSGVEPGVEPASGSTEAGEVPQQSGSTLPVAGVAPRGFEFASGFLEFGDFDPYALGDNGFNPCTEITEQEFVEAGFEGMNYDGENPLSKGLAVCDFASDRDDAAGGGVYGGVIDRRIAEQRGLILAEYQSKVLPELYTLAAANGMEGVCYTQIDTVRGGFGTQAGGSPRRTTTGEACEMAIEYAERLFLNYGTPSDHD